MSNGPSPNFTRDARGHVINGLLVQKSTTKKCEPIDRFYALDADGNRKYFGNSRNAAEAIRRFRKWEAVERREIISIGKRIENPDEPAEFEDVFARAREGETVTFTVHPDGTVTDESDVAADAFWEKVAEQIRANPKLAAQKTGIEELAYLDQLKPLPPSVTLKAIGDLYQYDKHASLTPKEWANSKTWWKEFGEFTGARYARDLGRESFRKYRNHVLGKMRELKRSNAFARSRFGKIKTIINHALSEMDIPKEDRAALELRSLLRQPPKPSPNPTDITPTEFRKSLQQGSAWDKALFLVALNCAYYPIDCQRLRWNMIDFDRGTIRFDREKATGRAKAPVPRVAVLWKRTLDALKKIPRNHEHVFAVPSGKSGKYRPPHTETLARRFVAARDAAGIQRKITFANLRDSALTAAAESTDPAVPIQQYHVLAGHAAKGVDDAYISRNPRFVHTACDAVGRRYLAHSAQFVPVAL